MGKNKTYYQKSAAKEFFDILKWPGLILLAGGFGAGGMLLAFDAQQNYFAHKGEGIPLLVDGLHQKKGNHLYIATDQFYEMLTYETSEQEQLNAVNGISAAVDALDKFNSQLNYKFCTTNDAMATKFNIPKVDKVGKQDIPLYITDGVLDNSEYVMAHTDWSYDSWTFEMKDVSITYRKKYLTAVLKQYETPEEMFDVKNLASYKTTAHEGIHCQGGRHIDKKEERLSIMNPYLSFYGYNDFYQEDIKMLDDYNVQFYGAEPTYSPEKYPEYKSIEDFKTDDVTITLNSKNSTASYANIDDELGM